MIHTIKFKNYKSFKDEQVLQIKPITILIGKNSAGKSAITKLPTLLSNSLQGNFSEPLKLMNGGVELGAEFRDLVYGRTRLGKLEFTLEDELEKLSVVIGSGVRSDDSPEIYSWNLTSSETARSFELGNDKSFNGFQIEDDQNLLQFKSLSINTDYIGPFRVIPERQYSNIKHVNANHIGICGENSYSILIKDSFTSDKLLIDSVNQWYKEHFDGWGVKVNSDTEPFYQLELFRDANKIDVNFKDVGQGMSQLLPIVVRSFMPTAKETLIVIEQPELHLHPGAHGDIAELLCKSLKSGLKKFLIETHSQNFVLRLRSLIASKKINSDDVAIYYVAFDAESNSSSMTKINVDDKGNVDHWPTGIFDEALYETIALKTAQSDFN